MPTQTEIAKRWGVSKVRVHQLVKEGCPTSTFRAADNWRKKRDLLREPVANRKPIEASETEETPRELARKNSAGPPLPVIPEPEETGDSLLDALNAGIYVHKMALRQYKQAVRDGSVTQSARLSEHNKALEYRMKAETMYREEQERQGILVNKHAVLQLARKSIEAVIRRLERLPIEAGPQCNPGNPLQATKILERAVNDVRSAGARAVEDLLAKKNLEGAYGSITKLA